MTDPVKELAMLIMKSPMSQSREAIADWLTAREAPLKAEIAELETFRVRHALVRAKLNGISAACQLSGGEFGRAVYGSIGDVLAVLDGESADTSSGAGLSVGGL